MEIFYQLAAFVFFGALCFIFGAVAGCRGGREELKKEAQARMEEYQRSRKQMSPEGSGRPH